MASWGVHLVLASASPRRADLLRAAGFQFVVQPADVDERRLAGEPADAYVRRLAVEKARAAHRRDEPGRITLGADTAVVVDGDILGKPADAADAASMLRRLSGRTHQVLTGVCLCHRTDELSHVEVTTVEFRRLSTVDADWYVQSGEGTDKAGGYAIQGLASRFVTRLEGSYSNVVGLPVAAVTALLDRIPGAVSDLSPGMAPEAAAGPRTGVRAGVQG